MHIVGFDLGKRKSQLCIAAEDGTIVQEKRIDTAREALSRFFGALGPCRVLIESSTSSEWVATTLEELGVEVVVADPSYAPMYARADKRVKTDRRDARALCEALRLGAFRRAHRRSRENREMQALLGARDGLVRARTSMINRTRAILEREGYRPRICNAEYFVEAVGEIEIDSALVEIIHALVSEIAGFTDLIREYDEKIAQRTKGNAAVQHLDTVVGIGVLTASAIVTALDDVKRFETASQVTSYLGLVPSENSSSDNRRRGRITKAGDPRARALLVEAAWCILRSKKPEVQPLRAWAERIQERRGKGRGAVALARKLARILYAMWRDGTAFDIAKARLTKEAA